MSTADAWLDEAEMDWGTRPVPPLRRAPRRASSRSRGRAGRAALAALAVAVLAGALAVVDLEPAGSPARTPALRAPAPAAAAPIPATAALEAIADCESRGDPAAVSADGRYRGKYQFDLATWRSVGGTGDPALAPEPEQDRRARALAARRGAQPWPVCGPAAGAR